jgi:hypothetical protein
MCPAAVYEVRDGAFQLQIEVCFRFRARSQPTSYPGSTRLHPAASIPNQGIPGCF